MTNIAPFNPLSNSGPRRLTNLTFHFGTSYSDCGRIYLQNSECCFFWILLGWIVEDMLKKQTKNGLLYYYFCVYRFKKNGVRYNEDLCRLFIYLL